jgi:hypothetical protein
MCNCKEQSTLVDISSCHADFISSLNQLDVGNWILLLSCPKCHQLWRVDDMGKYEAYYAVKIPSQENWKAFDVESLIKEKMIENRGGLTQNYCMWTKCDAKKVKGSTFCVNHLWVTGSRA